MYTASRACDKSTWTGGKLPVESSVWQLPSSRPAYGDAMIEGDKRYVATVTKDTLRRMSTWSKETKDGRFGKK